MSDNPRIMYVTFDATQGTILDMIRVSKTTIFRHTTIHDTTLYSAAIIYSLRNIILFLIDLPILYFLDQDTCTLLYLLDIDLRLMYQITI
jgi:hypothetical protein